MIKKILAVFALCLIIAPAQAADTYGYLAVWQNPQDENDVLQIKTTKEDSTQDESLAELEAFCKGQDTLAGIGEDQATGCRCTVEKYLCCIGVSESRGRSAYR